MARIHVGDIKARRITGQPGSEDGLIELDIKNHPCLYIIALGRVDNPEHPDYPIPATSSVAFQSRNGEPFYDRFSAWTPPNLRILLTAATQYAYYGDDDTRICVRGMIGRDPTDRLNPIADELPGLDARTYNSLARGGITTLHQLQACSDEDLLAIRNLGARTLKRIRQALTEQASK